jgi:hypothetical protein
VFGGGGKASRRVFKPLQLDNQMLRLSVLLLTVLSVNAFQTGRFLLI